MTQTGIKLTYLPGAWRLKVNYELIDLSLLNLLFFYT